MEGAAASPSEVLARGRRRCSTRQPRRSSIDRRGSTSARAPRSPASRGRGNAARSRDCAFAGVVARDRQVEIAVEHVREHAEKARPAEDRLARIERIMDLHAGRRVGHELHEALRARARDRTRIVVALDLVDRADELFGDLVVRRRLAAPSVVARETIRVSIARWRDGPTYDEPCRVFPVLLM